jgi:cob(I)alamin adenosyltransferase
MNDTEQQYRARMQRKKQHVDARISHAETDRGVLLVHTGNGKGKSSSAFGMVARALGHDQQIAVIQFIKGAASTGEETFFRRFPEVRYHVMGEGFTWETQDRARDIEKAQAAWETACHYLSDPEIDLVVLDELNIALKLDYLPIDRVCSALQSRPQTQSVVVTGRAAPKALIEIADTVTEMKLVKHAFQAGIKARKGIEL